ncbi:glycosyltransferase [Candidatus Omnitrophota bacterium]
MSSKRVLLMHISHISGHRSASLAIEKAIKAQSPQSETRSINLFNYVHPRGEGIINFLYMLMIRRFPFIWAYLYDNPYWVRKSRKLKDRIHRTNLPKLETLLKDFRPDVVVSTQAFPCGLVAYFKRIKGVDFPLIAVMTDFVPHSYWIYDNVDYYITASQEATQTLISKGIKPDRIKSLGIPFDLKFNQNQHLDKAGARKTLGLKEDFFTILVMGGGQGLGPIGTVIGVLDKLEFDVQLIVVCGTNKRVYAQLKKRLSSYKKEILLFDYAQNVEALMSAADIIITKPGGITCAEALCKKLPMLIISPIPGQEANNTAYLTAQGAAVGVKRPAGLIDIVTDLYNHPERLKELSQACLRISRPRSAEDIAQLLLNL